MLEEARYIEAFAHLRHLLEEYPRHLEAYYLLGKMMLDAGLPMLAQDMFRRVLNADPEHLLARIGLGIAHQQLDDNKAALWNLERAFELDPGNEELADEIRKLRGKFSGIEPDYVPLSHAGMARLYLKGDLYSRAATELRHILDEHPERVDLKLALAEAYWRDGQIVQAADKCQDLLKELPYCLKANLILGTLWLKSGQEEGRRYLERAQTIDPGNRLAAELFGADNFLQEQEIMVEKLTYDPGELPVDQEAEWFKRLEAVSVSVRVSEAMPETSDEEMRLVDITAGLDSQLQIPDWLEELGPLEEGETLSWLEEEEVEEEEIAAWLEAEEEEDAGPDWLQELELEEEGPEEAEPAELEAPPEAEEEIPDWLREMEPEEARAAAEELEEKPDWMGELEAPTVEEEAPEAAEEVPDWLQELQPSEAVTEEVPEGEEIPEWLQDLQAPEEPEAPETPEAWEAMEEEGEIPDWLQEIQASEEKAGPVKTGAVETEEMFGWTSFAGEEEAPPVEAEAEAAPLVEDEEEPALPVEAEAEAAPAEEVPDWLQELEPPKAEPAPPAEVEEIEDVPDWLQELEPAEAAEMVEELEEEEEIPAPMEQGEMLSGDDALAWLESLAAGKEDELREQAEAERRARVDEIMGRAPKEAVEEAPEEEEVEEVAPPVEAKAEPAPPAEVEEIEDVPDWLQELEPAEAAEMVEELEEEEEIPAPMEQGEMLSGDDALAWLESLAAGKEDELREQAEAERRARVDEIMGRAPREAVEEEVEEEAAPAEVEEAEKMPAEAEAELPAEPEEVSDWFRELEPEEIEEAAPPPEAAPAEEVPDWLQKLQPPEEPGPAEAEAVEAPSEVPDWLQELQPPVEEVAEEMEAKEITEEPAAEAAEVTPAAEQPPKEPEEAFFGWSGFEIEKAEREPEVAEKEEEPIISFGFTLFEEGEEEEIEAQAVEAEAVPAAPSPEEERALEEVPEAPEEIEEEVAEPEEPIAEALPPEAEAPVEIEVPRFDVAERAAYVEENKSDYQARIELARAFWNMGNIDEAVEHYTRLIRGSDLLDQVINDLKTYTDQKPDDPRPLQTLGDAYMKEGDLDRALDAYKQAMGLF